MFSASEKVIRLTKGEGDFISTANSLSPSINPAG